MASIPVAVVNNKVDNLDKKLDDFKVDVKSDMATISNQISSLSAKIEKTNKTHEDQYMKKSDFLPYKIALSAMGSFILAMLIYVTQLFLGKGIGQ